MVDVSICAPAKKNGVMDEEPAFAEKTKDFPTVLLQ